MHAQEVAQEVLVPQEHASVQAGARSENAMFLRFTRKNIRNGRS